MARRNGESGTDERVSHLYRNDLFYAHLSLYAHACSRARGADVLDVGCGTGYGAAYLAERGARRVVGVDRDPEAAALASRHFASAVVAFVVADAATLPSAGPEGFGLVLALNALEHFEDVPGFLASATASMRPDGALLVSVPPVTNADERLAEMANRHHLNVWSPRQWRHVIAPWFEAVALYRHDCVHPHISPDFRNEPCQTSLRETDFACRAVAADEDLAGTLSVVLVAERPVAPGLRPLAGQRPTFVDRSLSRRRPRWVPLPPDQLAAPSRPLRELPGRAMRLAVRRGPAALLAEGRAWLVWRFRRALALRELGRR